MNIEAVHDLYELRPLERRHIAALNPLADVGTVVAEAATIGYPVATDLLSDEG